MPSPNNIYDMLIEPIRVADQPGQFLLRYLKGMQLIWDDNYDAILTLPEITDYETVPDNAIRFLLWHVGLTSEFDDILSGVNTKGLRKVASILAQFWKLKGTQGSVTDLLRFAFGSEPQFFDFFFFRWLVGENALDELWDGGDTWVLNPNEPDYGAYWSLIQIEDIKRDIDQNLLRFLLGLARPSSERFRVALVDMLELFLNDDRWTKTGSGVISVQDGIYKIAGGFAEVLFDMPQAFNWSEYEVKFKFKFTNYTSGTPRVKLWWYSDNNVDNAYGVEIQDGVQQLKLLNSTVESSIGSPANKSIDMGVWYTVTALIQLGNKGLVSEYTRMIVQLDGVPIIDYIDSSNIHSQGSVVFKKMAGTYDMWVDFVKVNPIPARIVDIVPQGV